MSLPRKSKTYRIYHPETGRFSEVLRTEFNRYLGSFLTRFSKDSDVRAVLDADPRLAILMPGIKMKVCPSTKQLDFFKPKLALDIRTNFEILYRAWLYDPKSQEPVVSVEDTIQQMTPEGYTPPRATFLNQAFQ